MTKAGKPQVVVLCEDRAHFHFIREFLELCGWDRRKIIERMASSGEGSAEAWVRKKYATEIKAHRAARNYRNIALVVMIDADLRSIQHRIAQLEQSAEIQQLDQQPRTKSEKIAIFVPRWNIETWFCYLDGGKCSETHDYKQAYKDSKPRKFAEILDGLCRQKGALKDMPLSLKHACNEWQRLK